MTKKIDSDLSKVIHIELEALSKSKGKDHTCFDTGKLSPYPLANVIGLYMDEKFPKKFYLKIDTDKVGGQIFVYKK